MNPNAKNKTQHTAVQIMEDSNLEISDVPITNKSTKNTEIRLGTLESLMSKTMNGTNEIARKKKPVALKKEIQRFSPVKKNISSLFRKEMTEQVNMKTVNAVNMDHLSAFRIVALACNEPKLCFLKPGVKR